MANFYDEIEIEDFEYDPEEEVFYYPCPCGDRFQISREELDFGEEFATCPSCSLVVRVIYDKGVYQDDSETIEEQEEQMERNMRQLNLN